jgi:hypothetical protein
LPVLFAALAIVALGELTAVDGNACTPRGPDPVPSSAPAVVPAGSGAALPKNAGLVLSIYDGGLAEADVKASLKIEVRAADTLIAGTFAAVDERALIPGFRTWLWKPTGVELPVGTLAVRVLLSGTRSGTAETSVEIADRLLVVPTAAVDSLVATRLIVEDPGAPKITCDITSYLGSCGYPPSTLATRHIGVPQFNSARAPLDPADAVYLRQSLSLYGRNADGSIGESDRRDVGESVPHLDQAYPQYCVELTTRSIVDGTAVTTEKCISHGALDLTVSDAENESTLNTALQSCPNAVYPAGTSEGNPAGAPESSSASGCSASPRSSTGGGLGLCVVGLGLVMVSLRRRLGRTWG